jgi:hypothetical protein
MGGGDLLGSRAAYVPLPSAGSVDKCADRALCPQFVISANGFFRLPHADFHALSLQIIQSLGTDLEPPMHPRAQNHHFDSVVKEFCHVRRLNSGRMLSTRFTPIPLTGAPGKEFDVFE